MRKCIDCHNNKAEVPDRNRTGRPIKRICRECHGDRLVGDFSAILRRKQRKEQADE